MAEENTTDGSSNIVRRVYMVRKRWKPNSVTANDEVIAVFTSSLVADSYVTYAQSDSVEQLYVQRWNLSHTIHVGGQTISGPRTPELVF